MSDELFVDGICELDDENIQTYFSQFGFRIKTYESHRQRSTNSCCFAILTFESYQPVNAILRRRPHEINHYSLFVKRLLPPNTCSFIERLLPVSSVFIYNKFNRNLDEDKLRKYFSTFGQILKFEHDSIRSRLLIEYDDYDSVDKIFLNKDHLPDHIEVHKNILPNVQNAIKYHGTCRRKQKESSIEDKKKTRHHSKNSHFDQQYQDLLQKTITELIDCKAQLRNKDNDYLLLQFEYNQMKNENEKLNQFIEEQNQIVQPCFICHEYETIVNSLQERLVQLNEQYEIIKSEYEQLLAIQQTSIISYKSESDILKTNFTRRPHYVLSTRLNYDENQKYEVSDTSSSHLTVSTSDFSDAVHTKQVFSTPKIQSRIQLH